jgi:hypothetical protein
MRHHSPTRSRPRAQNVPTTAPSLLRQARLLAGFGLREAAVTVGVSAARLCRVERGVGGAYLADAERERLERLYRERLALT